MNMADEFTVSSTWRRAFSPPEVIPERADVVIIGGGIVGISTAWFLARQGVDVVVCEKGHIAGEQSGRNWGWVRVQGRDEREVPMAIESQRIWAGLADEIGEDVGFERGGCFFVAKNDKDMAGFHRWAKLAENYELDTRVLDSKGVLEKIPTSGLPWKGALYTSTDGRAEPHKATPALARAAERSGATILTSCAVRGIETSAGEVSAVVTEHGVIQTSVVLCAAGAWTSMFCRSLDIDLPQLCVRGTVARTAPTENVFNGNLHDDHLGIRRRQDGGYSVAHGLILEHVVTPSSFRYFGKFFKALLHEIRAVRLRFGREFVDEWRVPRQWPLDQPTLFEQTRVLSPEPNTQVLEAIQENLGVVFPDLKDTPLVEAWCGVIESTPDIVPVIDEVTSMRGFFIATGFSGHGFGIGPGAGKAIAGMLTGNDSGIDLSAFHLSRFFDGSPIRPMAGL